MTLGPWRETDRGEGPSPLRRGALALGVIVPLLWTAAGAQDPIEIDVDPVEDYVLFRVAGKTLPGGPDRIRNGLLDEDYRILADLDGNGTREPVYKLTYRVESLLNKGKFNDVVIFRDKDNLGISVEETLIVRGCKESTSKPPDGCTGTGIPASMYGRLLGKIYAYKEPGGDGVSVDGATLEVPSVSQKSAQ